MSLNCIAVLGPSIRTSVCRPCIEPFACESYRRAATARLHGRSRYEVTPKRHHDHLIDVESGRIIEFRCPEIERLQTEIAHRHGYRILDHRLDIYVTPIQPIKKPQG